MRTFSGFHFFPDANHRTGMISLENIMKANGIEYASKLPGEHRNRAVLRSKLLRILHIDRVDLSDLWVRDEYYFHWLRYFETLFHPHANSFSTECELDSLREALEAARSEERNWF